MLGIYKKNLIYVFVVMVKSKKKKLQTLLNA